MNEPSILPPIFKELIDIADNLDKLTPEVLDGYYAAVGEDESLIPELISVLGPHTFETLIRYFGGHTIKLPKVGDIVARGSSHDSDG
jgi:hypothetical protein